MKAQAAMEYLMTYGWALLVIVIVLGSLFYLGVFSPQTSVQDFCSIPGEISCEIMGLSEDGELIIKLTNLQPAQLTNVQIEWISDDELEYVSDPQSLNIGETKVFTLVTQEKGTIGNSKQGKIQVSYSTGTNDLKKTLTGTILAVYSIPSITEEPHDELILDGNETETENGNETETDEEDDELHLGDNNQTNKTDENKKCTLGDIITTKTNTNNWNGNVQRGETTSVNVLGEDCVNSITTKIVVTFDNPVEYGDYNIRDLSLTPSGFNNYAYINKVSSNSITWYEEGAYAKLKMGEKLNLDNGKKIVLADAYTHSGYKIAIIEIENAQGEIIETHTIKEGTMEINLDGEITKLQVYNINVDPYLTNVYVEIVVISYENQLKEGNIGTSYSSGWKLIGTLTYQKTNDGLTGFTLEIDAVYTGESGPEEPDPEPIPDCVYLGSEIEISSHMVSEVGAIQNIEKTYLYYEGELCSETKYLLSSESRFDFPLPYNENIFRIKEQKNRLNLNEIFDLKLYDGTTIELNEMIDNSSVRIIIRDFEDLEIMNTIVSEGNNNINTGMKQYVLTIDKIHYLENYVESIEIYEEVKGHKYRKQIKFEDESWLLGYFDSNTLSLYKESQYSPNLMIGESLDIGDGNKLILADVMDVSYGVQEARLEIRNAQGEPVSIMNQGRGITVYNIGSLKYKIMLYDISTSPNLNPYDMYVKVGIISEEIEYKQGIIEESEEEDIIRKTKLNVYTSETGLEGFKLEYETTYPN